MFGSRCFIIIQTAMVIVWIAVNLIAAVYRLTRTRSSCSTACFLSTRPPGAVDLLSQNREADTDRVKVEHDHRVNQLALQ